MNRIIMIAVTLAILIMACAGSASIPDPASGTAISTTFEATPESVITGVENTFVFNSVSCDACGYNVEFNLETIRSMSRDEVIGLIYLIEFYRPPITPSKELGCEIARKLLPRFFNK